MGSEARSRDASRKPKRYSVIGTGELGAIRDELEGAMRAKAVAEAALKREVEANRRSKEAIKSDLEDLRHKLRQASSEGMKVKANLRAEREKTERLRAELEQIFTREAMLTEQLQIDRMLTKKLRENWRNTTTSTSAIRKIRQ